VGIVGAVLVLQAGIFALILASSLVLSSGGKYAGFGLLSQAGLALALTMLFARTFPEFGSEAGALTLSVVALNELLAPVAYRIALAAGRPGASRFASWTRASSGRRRKPARAERASARL
jgi:hypothetical protein